MYEADDKDAEFTHTSEKLNLHEVGPRLYITHTSSLPLLSLVSKQSVRNLIKNDALHLSSFFLIFSCLPV